MNSHQIPERHSAAALTVETGLDDDLLLQPASGMRGRAEDQAVSPRGTQTRRDMSACSGSQSNNFKRSDEI